MAEITNSTTDSLEISDNITDVEYYGSLLGANIYFANKLRTESWSDASTTDRIKALAQATEEIDMLWFSGEKTNPDQPLEFPRYNQNVVPKEIEYATYEQAYALINNLDPDQELKASKIKREKFDTHEIEFFDRQPTAPTTAGILSAKAWRYLTPFLRDTTELSLMKV